MVDARQTNLSKVLAPARQLRVPLYQRRYAWTRPQWDALWDDIARLAVERQKRHDATHFVGSLVLAPVATAVGAPVDRALLVVDGQQRLLTISLLLAALRDCGALPAPLKKRILRCLLQNASGNLPSEKRLKVLPTQLDQAAYAQLILGEPDPADDGLARAYRHFVKKIKLLAEDQDEAIARIPLARFADAVLAGLQCVVISAEAQDNVHRIFESLNNRGTELTQADLIRNYVFMRLTSGAAQFYEFSWMPLEKQFTADELTLLFWLSLVRDQPTITQRQTYIEQQKRLQQMTTPTQLKSALRRVMDDAVLLELILRPEREASIKVQLRLQRLKDWGSTTAQPMLMYLLRLRAEGKADSHQVSRAMRYLESYYVRRMVMGRATMNMNRVLLAAPKHLHAARGPVDEELRKYLSGEGKHWATDYELRKEVVQTPFYRHGRAHQKMLVLKWIERELGDMEVDFDPDLTIEHVMPQHLTQAWRAELLRGQPAGTSADYLHGQLVHTLGNLTLTRRNSSLSDKSFGDKKAIIHKYGSNLKMNKDVTPNHHWDAAKIQWRSKLMVERIIKNWPGPADE